MYDVSRLGSGFHATSGGGHARRFRRAGIASMAGIAAMVAVSVIGTGAASATAKHKTTHGGSRSASTSKWKLTTVTDPGKLETLSCPSTKLCVAIDDSGNAVIATNPTGGPSAWKMTDINGTTNATSISCPSVHLCVAVDGSGNAITSTNPTGGAAAWTVAEVDTVFYNSLDGVSCPSVRLCVAVDISGDVVTSTNPTGGAAAWVTTANVDPEPPNGNPDANSIDSIECPSTTLCVAGDFSGNIITTTDPTGPASAWTVFPVEANSDIGTISCPNVHLCMAVGHADVWTSTNPAGGTSAWKKTSFQVPLAAAYCQSTHLCVAEDVATDVLSTTDATGRSKTWKTATTVAATSNHLGGGVDCPSAKLCVVMGEDNVVTSTNP